MRLCTGKRLEAGAAKHVQDILPELVKVLLSSLSLPISTDPGPGANGGLNQVAVEERVLRCSAAAGLDALSSS